MPGSRLKVDPSEQMIRLGEDFFLEGVQKLVGYGLLEPQMAYNRRQRFTKKRVAVVEFATGCELILRGILRKNGCAIYNRNINEVIRSCYDQYPSLTNEHNSIEELRKLRNEIVHGAIERGDKKRSYFIGAISCLTKLYGTEKITRKAFIQRINEVARSF